MTAAPSAPWTRRWSAVIVLAALGLVLAACAAAFWYADAQGERVIAAQQRDALSNELDLLAQVQADEGDLALARAIARRAAFGGGTGLSALRSKDGALVAGDLDAWPSGLAADEAWARVQTIDGRFHGQVATRTLARGYVVLVGDDDDAFRDFRRGISGAMWIAIAIVAVSCLGLAAATTNFVLQRVRRLSEVAARVSAGDFSARAPQAAMGGPFGEIAAAQNAMLDRIENLIVGLRTVTDSLAHDLRTPLAQVRRRLELGLTEAAPDAKQAALEDALTQTDKTLATFTALVDIARADGGLSRDAMAQTDLSELAHAVHELFEPLAEERGVALKAEIGAPLVLSVHKPLLMQAMSNLVHNAIKYAPANSEVTMALTRTGEGAEFVVADHGAGIPPERRADAVQRFKRLDTASSGQDGLGLGLAIVDACARLHGGALSLEDNAPGLRARLRIAH